MNKTNTIYTKFTRALHKFLLDKLLLLIPKQLKDFLTGFNKLDSLGAIRISVVRFNILLIENEKSVVKYLFLLGLGCLILEGELCPCLQNVFFSSLSIIILVNCYGYYLIHNVKLKQLYPWLNLLIEFTFIILLALNIESLLESLSQISDIWFSILKKLFKVLFDCIVKITGEKRSPVESSNSGPTGSTGAGGPSGPEEGLIHVQDNWESSEKKRKKMIKLYKVYEKPNDKLTGKEKEIILEHSKEYGTDIEKYYQDKDYILTQGDAVEHWIDFYKKENKINFDMRTAEMDLGKIYAKPEEEWTNDEKTQVEKHKANYPFNSEQYTEKVTYLVAKLAKNQEYRAKRAKTKGMEFQLGNIYNKDFASWTEEENTLVDKHKLEFKDQQKYEFAVEDLIAIVNRRKSDRRNQYENYSLNRELTRAYSKDLDKRTEEENNMLEEHKKKFTSEQDYLQDISQKVEATNKEVERISNSSRKFGEIAKEVRKISRIWEKDPVARTEDEKDMLEQYKNTYSTEDEFKKRMLEQRETKRKQSESKKLYYQKKRRITEKTD